MLAATFTNVPSRVHESVNRFFKSPFEFRSSHLPRYVHAIMFSIIRDCMISGFRREVEEVYAFPGYYAETSGNSDVSGQPIGPVSKTKDLRVGPT